MRSYLSKKPTRATFAGCTCREQPRRNAAECDQQIPSSDGDCHTPLPREVRKDNVSRHERAVFTFGRAGTPLLSASDLNDR
jgi:hypothetical protein